MSDPTPDPVHVAASSNTDRFYTQLKSLREYDKLEVECVIANLLTPTEEESCSIATYIRTVSNVESLLQLKSSKDFQAIAMIARALFELAADLRFLEITPNGWIKMKIHADLEKLHLAHKVIAFKNANPDVTTDTTIYQTFIGKNSVRLKALRKSVWPTNNSPRHWSGMRLDARCEVLKAPFDQIYAEDYSRVSWYVHPGVTGVFYVPAVTFIHICAYVYHLATRSYREALLCMIRVFKLSKGNEHIETRLDAAMKFPFTDTDEQVQVLRERAGL